MASALPACAGVFMRAHCPHPRLFEDEYKRCFPHCCPHHVDRSYCGSSLEVVLRFGGESDVSQSVDHDVQAAREPFDVKNVFVFARFETVDAKPPSGAYSLRYLRSVSQSEVNPEASWIEGVRQTAADRQQHSQQLHGRQPASRSSSSRDTSPPDSATYVLNGQAFAKWYYHWESGANKVQRATKHALKAYVFYQTQEGQTSGPVQATSLQHSQQHHQQGEASTVQQGPARDGALELLCVVTSPPFTVVSYRRAPLDASGALGSPGALGLGGIDAAAALMPHYATDTAHPVDSRLRRLVQNQISRAFQEYNQQQQRHNEARGSSDEALAPFRSLRSQDERDEDLQASEDRSTNERYRQLQEREGLRFRLLTPEDAAQSGSALHGQIQPREPRLVFDSMRRREDDQRWRNTNTENDGEFVDDYDEDDVRGEAVPQALTPQSWARQSPSAYEAKVTGPVGMPPSTTDPIRQAERAAGVAVQRFKQQQHQLDSHPRELQQLTDLGIVHFFVSRITTSSANSMANLEVVLTIAISQHWRYASGGATHLARLLMSISSGGDVRSPVTISSRNDTGSLTDKKREELMLVLGEVCVWAFSPENLALVQSLLTACHPLLLDNLNGSGNNDDDGKELRTAFLDCVARCWSALDGFLQSPRATQTTVRSVRELSDAILGVVFSDPELEELRSGLKAMLQRPAILLEDSKENSSSGPDTHASVTPRCNLVGWRGFVAQVREGYLRDQYSGRGLPWCPVQGTAPPNRWAADWLLQPGSLAVTPHVSSQIRTRGAQIRDVIQAGPVSPRLTKQDVPSLWTTCLALSQLLLLKLAVAGDPLHTLYVQAEPSVLSRDNAWLRLICDGRVRVAPVAPNGLTSLMGGASCGFGGDYVAYRLEGQPAADTISGPVDSSDRRSAPDSSICVEFYWWPQSEALDRLVAYRSVVTLKTATSGAFMEARMDLERGFVERDAGAIAVVPELELWAPSERVQAVASWQPWLSVEGVYARH